MGNTVVAALEDTTLIQPRAMRRLPECHYCLLCAHEPFLVCAVHPYGSEGDRCLDFRPDPDLDGKHFVDFLGLEAQQDEPYTNPYDLEPDEELWEPEGARYIDGELVIERSFYNGEEIIQPRQRWTKQEQLEILDTHPLFTGKCPQCRYQFERDYTARVHWDCPECGWIDDAVK